MRNFKTRMIVKKILLEKSHSRQFKMLILMLTLHLRQTRMTVLSIQMLSETTGK